ncbi:MAG TPA: DegT/DnrJ/EryC1/StrS family aminotransferase [Bacteroidota bacterium]|nr:DegT/DnrJ/EryC1/StrS family aminotransferase [Bacteroidota bacterium]
MQIPFVDLKSQYHAIKKEIDSAIEGVLESTAFVLGKSVSEFEQSFAKAHNVAHCVGTSSGTDGNHLALWALGLGPGDEVIVPNDTFIATAWGATLCGATPVFVDCEPDSYNIDPKKVEERITPRTKAIVVVHLYGQSADLDPLLQIAKRRNIHLVEDCAQGHFAEYKGKRVGGFGITSSFSFYPGKNLGAYGEAGAATTNDVELAKKFRLFRDHGSVEKYSHESYGHNYRMEGIQGAVLGVKLRYLDEWTRKRRAVAAKYNELLKGVGDIVLPKEMPYAKHVYHLYVIRTGNRDRMQKYLQERGVATGLHYPSPLHVQKCFSHLGYKADDFPVSVNLARQCLSLPMYPELTDAQIEYVCSNVRAFFD